MLLFYCATMYAQQKNDPKERDFLITAGPFLTSFIVTDERFSSGIYSGTQPGGLLDVQIKNEKVSQKFSAFYSNGHLSSDQTTDNRLQQLFLDVNYERLYALTRSEDSYFQLFAGGQVGVLYVKRDYPTFINRKKTFEFAASAGAGLLVSHTFKTGLMKGFIVNNHLNIPVFSLVQQPAFGSERTAGNLTGDGYTFSSFFKESKLMFFGSFVRIKNNLELTKYFKKKHGVSIGYTWGYYQISANLKVKQANHSASICYTLIL